MIKSVTFINRVYPPDAGATGQILEELAQALVARGWQVRVIAGQTTATGGHQNRDSRVSVRRVPALPFARTSNWRRALSYLSLYPALLWGNWRSPSADVVVTMTDPPLQAAMGPVLKFTTGARLVHWAQDIYPELAEQLGVLKPDGLQVKFLRMVSNWALGRHDGIIAIGQCMRARLIGRGEAISHVPISTIPNWADSGTVRPRQHQDNPFRTEHNLENRFIVMYSGNLGLAHPFEAIVKAAEILADTLPEALFLFVGDGPRLQWVKQAVRERELRNVSFLPFQPKSRLRDSLSAADLHIASMLPNLCGLVVPSKVYGILAAGRPCLFLGPERSEAARAIVDSRSGSVIDNPDGAALATCIQEWFNDPTRRQDAGQAARRAAEAWTLEQAADAFSAVLDSVVQRPAPDQRADYRQP